MNNQDMQKGRILKLQAQKKAKSQADERMGCWAAILVSGFLGVAFLAVGISLLVSQGRFSFKSILLGAGFAVLTLVFFKIRPRKTKTAVPYAPSDGSLDLEDLEDVYDYITDDSDADIDAD